MSALSHAAVVTSSFSNISGTTWQVDLSLTNDGPSAGLADLTVYFSETSFANLVAKATPAGWDPLVAQPELGPLQSAGFVDYLLFDPSKPLGIGQSQAGFSIQFTYLGAGAPDSLRFEGYDANFNRLFEGQTTVSAIPEPSTSLLMAAGLGIVGFGVSRQRRRNAAAGETLASGVAA